jgi:CRP-like cAMP-binding protein
VLPPAYQDSSNKSRRSLMDKLKVLKKSELFSTLDDKELRIIETIAEPQQVVAGEIVCKQGKREEKIYTVEDGAVAIVLEVGAMANRQVQAACSAESFGWSALVEPYICTASVKAIEKTTLLAFDANTLREICKKYPDIGCKIYQSVARVVAKRLRQAYVQLLGVTEEQ